MIKVKKAKIKAKGIVPVLIGELGVAIRGVAETISRNIGREAAEELVSFVCDEAIKSFRNDLPKAETKDNSEEDTETEKATS